MSVVLNGTVVIDPKRNLYGLAVIRRESSLGAKTVIQIGVRVKGAKKLRLYREDSLQLIGPYAIVQSKLCVVVKVDASAAIAAIDEALSSVKEFRGLTLGAIREHGRSEHAFDELPVRHGSVEA